MDNDAPINGEGVLDALEAWYNRFISVTDPRDVWLLAVWTVSTWLAFELYTTPRLQIDSTMPGSGKTTVLDHLSRLAYRPVQAATVSSPALLPRLLEDGPRTILLDEVDRSLRPDKPGVPDLIGIINSGYRRGATRPVLVPTKGGGWEPKEMSTFGPVALAGNSPNLPDDTLSRCIRLLLMPDLDGVVEDSDWEYISDDAAELRIQIEAFAADVRDDVTGMKVDLPARCIGRSKEKWRPLKRVAVAAGDRWSKRVDELIGRDMAEDAAERDAGLRKLPPGMVLLTDLHAVFPHSLDGFAPTASLVDLVVAHNPDYWGDGSPYGKRLTAKRFGHLISQASKVTSQRPGGVGPRGYLRSHFETTWHRLRIGRPPLSQSGGSGEPGESGGEFQPGQPESPDPPDQKGHPPLCPDCVRAPARADTGRCDFCSVKARKQAQLASLPTNGETA
jgi:hypothetical protein